MLKSIGKLLSKSKNTAKFRIKVKDITNPGSKPNYGVDKTRDQFERHLFENGFDRKVINTPNGPINIFSKDGKKIFVARDFSKSTKGPSADFFKDGKLIGKLRFLNN